MNGQPQRPLWNFNEEMLYNTASEPENPIQGNTGEKTMNEEQLKHQNLEIMLKDMIVSWNQQIAISSTQKEYMEEQRYLIIKLEELLQQKNEVGEKITPEMNCLLEDIEEHLAEMTEMEFLLDKMKEAEEETKKKVLAQKHWIQEHFGLTLD
jgi:hypothetical protein